jgi:zinc transporter 9
MVLKLSIIFLIFLIPCMCIVVAQGYKPNVNVVLLEDLAAVLGVCVASTAMGLSLYLQSPIPDAIGSLIIGGILGGVASFIIYSNTAALVGR